MPTNPYASIEDSELAAVIRETGTTIQFDSPDCNTNGLLGFYQLSVDSDGDITKDVMTLCVKSHGANYSELHDTFRHESVHVAQACNQMLPLNSWEHLAPKVSDRDFNIIVRNYDRRDFHIELEAYVLAERLTNDQVAALVTESCLTE